MRYRTMIHDGRGWVLKEDADRLRDALEQIVAMAENADSPSHSMQGRTNAWANLGGLAVDIARVAFDEDERR